MIKKITSMIMSFVLVFAFASPSFADAKDNYLKDYEKLLEASTQGGTSSTGEGKFSLSLEDINQLEEMGMKDFKADITLKATSNATVNPLGAEVILDVDVNLQEEVKELLGDIDLKIPQIKIYMDDTALYMNKEFVNYLGQMAGSEKKIEQDYVKISYDVEGLQEMKDMTSTMKNQEKMMQATMAFLKKIDLGDISLDLKEDNGVYTANWDADKFVDITDAFIRYTMLNFEDVIDFYGELGVDYIEIVNDSYTAVGLPATTKEQMSKELKEAHDVYVAEVSQYLPKIKKLLAGTTMTMKEDFSKEGEYSSQFDLNLVFNLDVLNEFSQDMAMDGLVKVGISGAGKSVFSKDIKVDMPKDAVEIGEEFFEVPQMDMSDVEMTIDDYYFNLILDTKDSSYTYKEGDTVVEKGTIDMVTKNGALSVDSEKLAQILIFSEDFIDELTKEDMFAIRDLSSEEILSDYILIQWDNTTKQATVSF